MKNRWAQKCRRAIAALLSCSLTLGMVPAHAQASSRDLIGQQAPSVEIGTPSLGLVGASSGLSTNLSMPMLRQSPPQDAGSTPRGIQPPIGDGALRPAPPPPPPNEFQKFVQESIGHALPMFGAGFFGSASAKFNPQINTPVSDDYALGPGDEVLIRGWGSIDVDVRATVDRNGLISIPRVGAVPLAGVRAADAQGVIKSAVSRYYRDFQLSVTLGQLRGITVYVVGQARNPGAYTLASTSTLVTALFASGGPNATGSMRHVVVRRANRNVTELDLYAFIARGDKSADIKLQDGDTIVIPPARGYVALTGKVNTAAVYELQGGNDTLESLLALAGGLPVMADPRRAYLERMDPTRSPPRSVESFALDAQGLKKPVKNGDLLTVLSITPEFANAVTLRGNVDQPVRLPWKEGMKLRDLIPNKSYLLSRASLKRQNDALLSEEERQRTDDTTDQNGAIAEKRQAASGTNNNARPDRSNSTRQSRDTTDTLAERVGNLVDEVNLDYAVVERVNNADLSVKLLPFNLGRALEDAGSPDNLALTPGDIVTVFSVNDVRVPQGKRQVFVRVEGEVKRPGVYQMKPGDTLGQLVAQAGGLTQDAYLFGASFYREEVRKTQAENLDKIARRLEAEMQTRLSTAAASVSNMTGDNASAAHLRLQAETQAQKQSLDRLHNLKPSGRIMLGLKTGANTLDALPTLRLENLDRLVIPAKPDFVYVLGSVNTEASLIWQPGKTVQDCLDLAGMTSGADKDQIFVVRADGSVISDSDRWFSRVSRTEVMPGDTIVLPEKTDHETSWSIFTRNAKDITQIVYQFSLGAAAIKTLRE